MTTLPPVPEDLPEDERAVHEEVRAWFAAVEGPAVGRVSAATDPHAAPDGHALAVTAVSRTGLDHGRSTKIALLDTTTGRWRTRGQGNHDRLPRWSPDGRRLAYLSDLVPERGHQLVWTDPEDPGAGQVSASGPYLEGTVEGLDWSPDGARLLAVVREREGGPAGAGGSAPQRPSWWPQVERSERSTGWRHCAVVDVTTGRSWRVSPPGWTVWEAVWAGPAAIAAVISSEPGEEAWYRAQLVLLHVGEPGRPAPKPRPLHRGHVQLGRPAASPSGRWVTVVEAFSSDRSLVAGDLVLVDAADQSSHRLDTLGTDVASSSWRSEDVVFFVGVRGPQTVAGEVDVTTGIARELWVSDGGTRGVYPQAAQDASGTVYAVAEAYHRAPQVVAVTGGRERVLADLAHPGSDHLLRRAGTLRRVEWTGGDGLPLSGFLVVPGAEVASPPYPLVVDIHGGPVWAWQDQYAMRGSTGPLLASRGYAVLYINPRGSTGRGQDFARQVAHDMLGEDTDDFLTAVDHLVAEGVADPRRIGLTGTSYGATMALWLVTVDQRFAAAVALSGGSDWVSYHFTTSISDFDLLFLPGKPLDRAGEYVRRSPLTHSARVRTPVLQLAGQLDRDVPASQGLELHRALTMQGTESELVVYPEEGHGVDDLPALVDAVARTLVWFERHMPPDRAGGGAAG